MSDSNDESGLGSEREFNEPFTVGNVHDGHRFSTEEDDNSSTRSFSDLPPSQNGQGTNAPNRISSG